MKRALAGKLPCPGTIVFAGVVFALGLGACGADDTPREQGGSSGGAQTLKAGEKIAMRDRKYWPADAKVKLGQTVTWVGESVPHDVVATSGAQFKSKIFAKGGSFSWKADRPGSVRYHCTLHPGMNGTLTVER